MVHGSRDLISFSYMYLGAQIRGAQLILFEVSSRLDVGVIGAMRLAPQQSVALSQACRRLLAEAFTTVLYGVIVAGNKRQVTLAQTLDIVKAIGVV